MSISNEQKEENEEKRERTWLRVRFPRPTFAAAASFFCFSIAC